MQITKSADQDLKIEDIPDRGPDGEYRWSHGQESILIKENEELQSLKTSTNQIRDRIQDLEAEILSLESPKKQLVSETETEIEERTDKKEQLKEDLNLNLNEQQKCKKILHDRGKEYPPSEHEKGEEQELKEDVDNRNKSKEGIGIKDTLKKYSGSVLRWLAIESFITGTLILVLRETHSINEMIIRSGVIAFLVIGWEIAMYYYKKHRDNISMSYMILSATILIVLGLMPYYINYHYDVEEPVEVTRTLNLTDEQPVANGEEGKLSSQPKWVQFYLNYDYSLAIAGVFIGLFIVWPLYDPEKYQMAAIKDTPRDKYEPAESENNPWISRLNNLKNDEKWLRNELSRVKNKIQSLQNHPSEIIKINNHYQQLDEKISGKEDKLASEKDELKGVLKRVVSRLNKYKAEFTDLLSRDEIMDNIITPEWPTRDDILGYYNLQNEGDQL